MGDMVLIDSNELEALRVLARKALDSSENDQTFDLGSHGEVSNEDSSDDLETMSVGLDKDTDTRLIHEDFYLLSLNSRSMMVRLASAYPEYIAPDRLLSRFRKTANHPELEDCIVDPSTHISHVRSSLGRDAIETIFQMKVNSKGHLVRTGRCLGYRLGLRYAQELGL